MKKKLRIGIIDVVAKGPTQALFAKLMHANLAAIMPQVVGVWCEEAGHEVHFSCYTGTEDLLNILPNDVDLLFVTSFTEAAQFAYALSNYFRSKGAVTVMGGPHARCYPEDARKYFDYVVGFTDKNIIKDILDDAGPHRPYGRHLEAPQQPVYLPGVQRRWKFQQKCLEKSPWIKVIPMLASMGCPYTCSFCIDATVPYQPMEFEEISSDLRFIKKTMKLPIVAWHDPNFGVRFKDTLEAVERAIPDGSVNFIGESSLSILTESNVKRMAKNGFRAILPGIESWFDLGNKSRMAKTEGMEKVNAVSDQVQMILRHIPYMQTNFVIGMDADQGPEPFELTKKFVDKTPAAFPGYSLLTAFGAAAPANLEYQADKRVLPFPFHLLNNNQAMNVKPKNYGWKELYDHQISLVKHSFSFKAIARRFLSTRTTVPKFMNFVRAVSSEGWGRYKYHSEVRRRLDTDKTMLPYLEGESNVLPEFYLNIIKEDLGPMWDWLPEGSLDHDPYAYIKSQKSKPVPSGSAAM